MKQIEAIKESLKEWSNLENNIIQQAGELEDQIRDEINRLIVDASNRYRTSIWNICYLYVPDVRFGDPEYRNDGSCYIATINATVKLKPSPLYDILFGNAK